MTDTNSRPNCDSNHAVIKSDIENIKAEIKDIKVAIDGITGHVNRLDTETKLFSQDLSQIREILGSLKTSVDNLVAEITNLKIKPLERYEKLAIVIFSAVVGVIVGRYL